MRYATQIVALGAQLQDGSRQCEFRVWAPRAQRVRLQLLRDGQKSEIEMRADDGYFNLSADAGAGDRYFYILDENKPVPDPISRYLPEGVHGPTEIVDPNSFRWSDKDWRGLALRDYILYELHVGTFTPEGTFDAAISKFDYLKKLGVTAIELMPVAAFPGERNWGYDGASPYAVQRSYGGPDGLKRLVNAAHAMGLVVVLDVVYNHLGPEGNYLRMFGPYFTDRYQTPWGAAINYDGPDAEGVRQYFIENAIYWIREYHMDALRLDAVQTIHDNSSKHILTEIKESVADLTRELGREVCVIAESDENDSKLVLAWERGGYGLDAFWSDDFHHAAHAVLTRERNGYYQDFGRLGQVVKALQEGYAFQGEHFKYWCGPRGTSAKDVPLLANVICLQNHDQVGNRARGERLTNLCSWGQRHAAAALLLLAPETPLLFMGEEFDETAPFQFFTSFEDSGLAEAVCRGRREEFKEFADGASEWNQIPDPQDPATFERSKLHWSLINGENEMLDWYKALIGLRRRFIISGERHCTAELRNGAVVMQVTSSGPKVIVVANLKTNQLPPPEAAWKHMLFAADEAGAVAVYVE